MAIYKDENQSIQLNEVIYSYDEKDRMVLAEYYKWDELNEELRFSFIEECVYEGAGLLPTHQKRYALDGKLRKEKFHTYDLTSQLIETKTIYCDSSQVKRRYETVYNHPLPNQNLPWFIRELGYFNDLYTHPPENIWQTNLSDAKTLKYGYNYTYDPNGYIKTARVVSADGRDLKQVFAFDYYVSK